MLCSHCLIPKFVLCLAEAGSAKMIIKLILVIDIKNQKLKDIFDVPVIELEAYTLYFIWLKQYLIFSGSLGTRGGSPNVQTNPCRVHEVIIFHGNMLLGQHQPQREQLQGYPKQVT